MADFTKKTDIYIVGRPWRVIKDLLNDAKVVYNISMSEPTKDFFPLAKEELYVIRQRWSENGTLEITLAARLKSSIII